MIAALNAGDHDTVCRNLVNVLENFTLKKYPVVAQTKEEMKKFCQSGNVLMSGSGPTVFAVCKDESEAAATRDHMLQFNEESYATHTTY